MPLSIPAAASHHERVSELDGIRGWAALCVVAYHVVWQIFGVSAPSFRNLGTAFILDGPLAVAVFFVLSGDALSSVHIQGRKELKLGRVIVKRYFRLALPILAICFFIYVLKIDGLVFNDEAARLVHRSSYFGHWLDKPPVLQDTLIYAFRDVFFDSSAQDIDRFLWTIPFEMYGSFFVFVTLAVLRYSRRPYIVICGLFLLCLTAGETFYVSCFFMGMIFAVLRSRHYFERFKAGRYSNLFSGLAIATLVIVDSFEHLAEHHNATPFFADALVFCILCNKTLCGLLRTPLSLFLGKISFSLYLVQFPVLVSVTSYAIEAADRHDSLTSGWIGLIALVSIAICVSSAALFEPLDRLSIWASRRIAHFDGRVWFKKSVYRPATGSG